MPSWYCRHAPSRGLAGEDCEGPRHQRCGLRYEPAEYTLTPPGIRQAIGLPGIGVIRVSGAEVVPDAAAAIVYCDSHGWTVEFLPGETIAR